MYATMHYRSLSSLVKTTIVAFVVAYAMILDCDLPIFYTKFRVLGNVFFSNICKAESH